MTLGKTEKLSGDVPFYMTGVYDFACTPEMTEDTAKENQNSECIIMEEIGHFPMAENPELFNGFFIQCLMIMAQR